MAENEICIIAPRIQHKVEIFDDSILINLQFHPAVFQDVCRDFLTHHGELSTF